MLQATIDISVVRLADQGDEDGLLDMLRLMHNEAGPRTAEGEPLSFSEPKVRATIQKATIPNRNCPDRGQSWVGVIGEPKTLEASVCLSVAQPWYTDTELLNETWTFVHPQFRKTNNAKALIAFSMAIADALGLPLVMGVMSLDRQPAKARLMSRVLGCEPLGSVFQYNPRYDSAAGA